MPLRMSEKIDKLIESVDEIKQSRRIDSMLMRGSVVSLGVVMVIFISFMVNANREIGEIKATLVTTENIIKLRSTIDATKKDIHNELGGYLSLRSYIEIEAQRTITVADIFYLFGQKANIREEELEKFRNTAIFKLNNNVKLGTTRGGIN